MYTSSVVAFFVVVLIAIFVDIFCTDVTNLQRNNAWQVTPSTINKNSGPQLAPNVTTPWPALGQQRPSNNNRKAQWVQQNNIWVRNSQSNINSNNNNKQASSSFISRENGQNLGPQNQPNTQQRGLSRPAAQNQNVGQRESGQNLGPQNQPSGQRGSNRVVSQTQNVGQRMPQPVPSPTRGNSPNLSYRNIMIQPWSASTTSPNSNKNKLSTSSPNNNQNRLYAGILGPQGGGPTTPALSNNQLITGPATQNNNLNNQGKTNNVNEDETDFGSNNEQPTGGVDDNELREFSEVLLTKDVNNAAKYVTVNYQGMTSSRSTNDEAPQPLLSVDQKVFELPSIEKMAALYNNYILETNQNEVYTAQEKIEENNLLDTIVSTPVMQHARNFLISKGKMGKDPKVFKDTLRLIWFNMYSRGGGRIGSSGFEHVFLAELKNNQVSGLHNWLYFSEEESRNQANYLGYMKKISLGDKGAILKYHFTFHDVDKPVGSMFIGTSPELEMALYSTCFLLRANRICPLKMNGNRFIIRTYTYRYRGKNMIGSAFPEI